MAEKRNWEKTPCSDEYLEGMKEFHNSLNDPYPVKYFKDIVYAEREKRKLHIQMLRPCAFYTEEQLRNLRLPVVVFVQGSGWLKQDCYAFLPQLTEMARAGFVVASVEYQGSEETKAPAQIIDVKTAIRFLRAHAEEYHIDPDKILIRGESSGGQVAAVVGVSADCEEFETEEYAGYSSSVCGVVDFFGVTDIMELRKHPRKPELEEEPIEESFEYQFLGGEPDQMKEMVQKMNPETYISNEKEIPPFFIAHGDHDGTIPFHVSVKLYQKLKENNKRVEFYRLCGADHGPGVFSRKFEEIVISFLKSCI